VGRAFHVPPCLLLPPAAAAVVLVVVRPVALVWAAVLAALCMVAFTWTVVLAVVWSVTLVWAVVLAVVVLAWALVLATGLVLALTVVLALRVWITVALGAAYLSKQKRLIRLFFLPLYEQNFGNGEDLTQNPLARTPSRSIVFISFRYAHGQAVKSAAEPCLSLGAQVCLCTNFTHGRVKAADSSVA